MSVGRDLISVIMPCFNNGHRIALSIRSALAQTYRDLELIVIDDGSRDNSVEVIRGFRDPRMRLVRQENRGVSAARNRGLQEARGNYVAFLDADDTWELTCLQKLQSALCSHGNTGIAYCGWQNVGLSGGRGTPFIPPDYEGPRKAESLFANCRWPIHAALTVRALVKDAGAFDERFATSEDYLLWLKIGTRHRIVRVPEVLAYYNFYGTSQATGNRLRLALNHWQAQRQFLAENPSFVGALGRKKVHALMDGELLKKGLSLYWDRDLVGAKIVFRTVMRARYGSPKQWCLMLPSLLPLSWYRAVVGLRDRLS